MNYKEVIARIQKGDPKAQRALFDLSNKLLQSVAYRYCKNSMETSDILQETYIRIFANLSNFKYDNDAATLAWMKRITSTEAIRYLKKSKRWQQPDITLNTIEPSSSQLEYDDLYKTLLRLPTKQRIVFNMHALEGYSHEEIAKELEIATSSSRSLLSRARTTLQSIINNETVYGKV